MIRTDAAYGQGQIGQQLRMPFPRHAIAFSRVRLLIVCGPLQRGGLIKNSQAAAASERAGRSNPLTSLSSGRARGTLVPLSDSLFLIAWRRPCECRARRGPSGVRPRRSAPQTRLRNRPQLAVRILPSIHRGANLRPALTMVVRRRLKLFRVSRFFCHLSTDRLPGSSGQRLRSFVPQ